MCLFKFNCFSFYPSNNKIGYSDFVPRIKLPREIDSDKPKKKGYPPEASRAKEPKNVEPYSEAYYAAYDAIQWQPPTPES